MRKSRLNLFKSTSMMISVIAIVMIIGTIIIVAYVGFCIANESITDQISSGDQRSELADLKSQYGDLESKFDSVKSTYYSGGSDNVQKYNDARIKLDMAKEAINNVESALDAGKPSNEVTSRLDYAQKQLANATKAYEDL